jgi:hypothetical protein
MLADMNIGDGVNLFLFAHNDCISDFDYLGLCDTKKCKCGEDVTFAMYATLRMINQVYAAAPWYKKIAADKTMFGPIFSPWSWDIRWLKDYTSENWGSNPETCPCFNTVTFQGKCVSVDELNYMMFGWAIQLCNENRSEALAYLEAGLWARKLKWPEPADVTRRKVGFAAFGSDVS